MREAGNVTYLCLAVTVPFRRDVRISSHTSGKRYTLVGRKTGRRKRREKGIWSVTIDISFVLSVNQQS